MDSFAPLTESSLAAYAMAYALRNWRDEQEAIDWILDHGFTFRGDESIWAIE